MKSGLGKKFFICTYYVEHFIHIITNEIRRIMNMSQIVLFYNINF